MVTMAIQKSKWLLVLMSTLLPLYVAGKKAVGHSASSSMSTNNNNNLATEKEFPSSSSSSSSSLLLSRELIDRTYRAYNSDLTCEVGLSEKDENLKFFPFEFYYATEAETPDMSFLPDLETKMFKAVSSHVFWCYGQAPTDYGGRKLSDTEISQREQEIRLARRLGVISVSSGGWDITTDSKFLNENCVKYLLLWLFFWIFLLLSKPS